MNEKNEHHHRRQPSLTRPISLSYQLLPSLSPPLSFFQFQNSDAALIHSNSAAIKKNTAVIADVLLYTMRKDVLK